MSTSLKDLATTASSIINIVGPIIRFAVPGSDVAMKLASALEVGVKYLRFAADLQENHLTEIQKDLLAIKAEVEEMAKHGSSVPQEKWATVHSDIESSAARIRKAMGR